MKSGIRYFWLLPVGVILMMIVIGCSHDPVIATVGKLKIYESNLKPEVIRRVRGEENAAFMPLANRLELLDGIVVKKLKLQDAFERKIDQRPELVRERQDLLLSNAQRLLYDKEVRDKVIKESEVKDFWKHMDEEVRASHILIKMPKDANKIEQDVLKKRIDSIYTSVTKSGADFTAIAQRTTDDITTRDGDIGYFRWGRMVDEFQSAVWSLKKDEISKPFKTSYGWHIAKLTDRRKIERRSYDESRDMVYQQLMQIHRNDLMKKAQEFLEKLYQRYNLLVKRENIAMIAAKLPPSNLTATDPFALLSETEKDLPLVSFKPGKNNFGSFSEKPYYKQGKATVRSLIERFATSGRPAPVSDSAALREFAQQMVGEWILGDYVIEKNLTKDKKIVEETDKSMENDVIARVEAEQVTDRVAHPTDAELQTYLTQNMSRFVSMPAVDLIEVLFSDEASANKYAATAHKRGKISEAEAAKLTKRVTGGPKKGFLAKVSPSMFGNIGAYASRAKVGEVVGPIKEGPNFSVFQVKTRYPQEPLTLETGRDQITSAYKQERSSQLMKEWVTSLRTKYKTTIIEERVKAMFGGVKQPDSTKTKGSPIKPPLGGR